VYLAYGQRIECVWPLDLPRAPKGSPDVCITKAGAGHFLAGRKAAGVGMREDWFHHAVLEDGSTYLHWTDLFEFIVSRDGRHIQGHALKHASEESFKTYLLGHVLSFSLLRRGVEPDTASRVSAARSSPPDTPFSPTTCWFWNATATASLPIPVRRASRCIRQWRGACCATIRRAKR